MGKPYFLPLLIFLVCGHASAQVAVGDNSENCRANSYSVLSCIKLASVAALDHIRTFNPSLSGCEGEGTLLAFIDPFDYPLPKNNLDDLESGGTFLHQQPLVIRPFRNSKGGAGIPLMNFVPCNTFAEKRTEILPEVYQKIGREGLAFVLGATSPGKTIERNNVSPLPLMGNNGLESSAEMNHEFNKSLR